ncbi:MAG TPA: hypothetical protein VHS80_04635 [Chthoniobacterales bacterium]|jgi:hypothetical protein|nr:hypothetical protein [Chthoniobacterales bacterium]
MKIGRQLLLLVPAICLLGLNGCSTTTAGAGTDRAVHAAFMENADSWPDYEDNAVEANRNWYQMIE